MAEKGDQSFVELINEAHGLAAAQMKLDRQKCFISPLFDYPFQFPLVTISEGPNRGRHFGSEAMEYFVS
jgi:hypothetical protein